MFVSAGLDLHGRACNDDSVSLLNLKFVCPKIKNLNIKDVSPVGVSPGGLTVDTS